MYRGDFGLTVYTVPAAGVAVAIGARSAARDYSTNQPPLSDAAGTLLLFCVCWFYYVLVGSQPAQVGPTAFSVGGASHATVLFPSCEVTTIQWSDQNYTTTYKRQRKLCHQVFKKCSLDGGGASTVGGCSHLALVLSNTVSFFRDDARRSSSETGTSYYDVVQVVKCILHTALMHFAS